MASQKRQQRSPSRERLAQLSKEQQYLSSEFKIDNFYKDEKLNIKNLKTKIQQIRNKKEVRPNEFYSSISHEHEAVGERRVLPLSRQIKTKSRYHRNGLYQEDKNTISGFSTSRDHENNPESRLSTGIPKIRSIGKRQCFKQTKKPKHYMNFNRLEPIYQRTAKIQIKSTKEMQEFEENINFIWLLYDQLAQITRILSENKEWEKDTVFIQLVSEYRMKVCSSKLQFLIQMMKTCFTQRQSRVIVFSRLLENLSIIYIFVEIAERMFNTTDHKPFQIIQSSHLVNFVGICSNNLLLLLRLIILVYHSHLQLKPGIVQILTIIAKFEVQSYQEELTQLKDVILRMQHNNQLINIIQNKLNQRLNKDFQHSINKFLKNIEKIKLEGEEIDQEISHFSRLKSSLVFKPFFQFSYFIFEYLSYHLHRENYIGLFSPQIQTAPDPYLPLRHQFTVVINPLKVFLHQKKKIYVRAFTEKFLQDLQKKCNIIFWVQQVPRQADPFIDLIPNSKRYKKLYKHHCMYVETEKQVRLIKFMARVSCPKGKYLIIDSDGYHYPEEQNQCLIPLNWKGEPDDKKLLSVLDLVLPFLRQGTDLQKSMNLLRSKIEELTRKKKNKQ